MVNGSGTTPRQRELGKRIREARSEQALSQERLGLRAEVDRTYVAQLETGRRNPSLETLCRLANALSIDLGVLLQGLQGVPGRRSSP